MYNLLVKSDGWAESKDTIHVSRVFEHTEENVISKFILPNRLPNLDALTAFPCLFMQETCADQNSTVQIGKINRSSISSGTILIEYFFDRDIQPLTNQIIEDLAQDFGITNMFEFNRTHWAIKDINLHEVLLHNLQPRRQRPKVFSISDPERIEPTLISAMMPFGPSFNNVYSELKRAAESIGLKCRRADDIWENPAIMQDVVSLIDHSKIVICDCSGRNPNVYYEIGIAHTLGRETILITQSESDIPFDLRHLRYVKYLNNSEGLEKLSATLIQKLKTLTQK